jgi:predicted nuclease of predicted toxin-antitoxin system
VKFFADEGVDRQIVERLREEGHDVGYVAELSPGISDAVVLSRSREGACVLITADKDFGELVFRRHEATTGVLLLRLWGLKPATKASLVAAAVRAYGLELPGVFSVLTPGSLRIRRELSH